MRKVLVLTPSLDGRVDANYTYALTETIRQGMYQDILIQPLFIANEAIIQVARNDLLEMAANTDCDDVVWIDSDQVWAPEWFFQLLNYDKDVVGGTTRHKTDEVETYICKADPDNLELDKDGLLEAHGIGFAFCRLSRKALLALYRSGKKYTHHGKEKRWVFDIRPGNDDRLVTEDISMCQKLTKKGFKIYCAPHMTLVHIGSKAYAGNFADWIKRFKKERDKPAKKKRVKNGT